MIKKLLFVGVMIFSGVCAMDKSKLLCSKGFKIRAYIDNIEKSCLLTDKRDLPGNEKRISQQIFLLSHDLRRREKQALDEQRRFVQAIKELNYEHKQIIDKLAGLIRLVIQQRQITQGNRYG